MFHLGKLLARRTIEMKDTINKPRNVS